MSILIKGMTMPTSCDECRLFVDDGCVPQNQWLNEEGTNKRLDNCPLIELPPHGRLIDADAMQMEWFNLNFDRKITDGTLAYWNFQLSKIPTIIEAEEGE